MLQIESIPTATAPGALAGKERDHIMMTSEERRWGRRRVRTAAGREIALALPTGTTLAPGAIVTIEADWYLVVEAAAEPVLAVRPRDRDTAICVAFEVGNHHFPLALDGEDLLVPDDTAMVQLLTRLDIPWERRRAIFNPVARGHVHER
jgi:urease accessory protein UreE